MLLYCMSKCIALLFYKVGVDEVVAVYFPIMPSKIGLVDVKVQAQTATMGDTVHKKLLVEVSVQTRVFTAI